MLKTVCRGALAAALWVAAAASGATAELAPFVAAHRRAAAFAQSKQWSEAAKVYGAFAAGHAGEAGGALASIFQGILLRRELQQAAAAAQALARPLAAPRTPFGLALRRVARGWFARLQMERLDAALREYWTDEIEYPPTLQALVAHKLIGPRFLVDPWGKPLVYQTGRLKIAPEIPRQKYTLRCSALAGTSKDLPRILAESAAFGVGLKLQAVAAGRPMKASIIVGPGKSASVAEGGKLGAATVVKITPRAVVLIEGEKIAVLAL